MDKGLLPILRILNIGFLCYDAITFFLILLKLHASWKANVHHLSESVATVKRYKFKIQLQVVEPLPVIPVHVALKSSRSGSGGRNERGRCGEDRQWQSPADHEAKAKCNRCREFGHFARNCIAPCLLIDI